MNLLDANQRRLDAAELCSRGAKLREIVALVSLNITGAIYALRSRCGSGHPRGARLKVDDAMRHVAKFVQRIRVEFSEFIIKSLVSIML